MWFKQLKAFHLTQMIVANANELAKKLTPLHYTPCPPSHPQSSGFIPPVDEIDAPLVHGLNSCLMFALCIEEKILPASVIKDALMEKIKIVEETEARRMRQKEKLSYKDEVTQTLLPRAFSKFTTIYGYIDTRLQLLFINATSPKRVELFLSMFKKACGDVVESLDLIKPSALLTHWLKSKEYPHSFSIDKAAVLQDKAEQTRIIRCQQQDLFSSSIQTFIKEGCDVMQLGLTWQDRLSFQLTEDFSIKNLKLTDDDLADLKETGETKTQRFNADFLMMSELYSGVMQDLLKVFSRNQQEGAAKLAVAG